MYQEKDLEIYRQIKAPAELKNRISSSVKKTQKKQRTAWVAATASIVLMISVNSWVHLNNTILSVNNQPITYRSVEIESRNQGLWTASEGAKQSDLIVVPMEIDVEKCAHISISIGALQQSADQEAVMEMDISEKTVIYWTLNTDVENDPICTITVGEETYRYGLFKDDEKNDYTMQKLK